MLRCIVLGHRGARSVGQVTGFAISYDRIDMERPPDCCLKYERTLMAETVTKRVP